MKFFTCPKRFPVLFSFIIVFVLIISAFGLHVKRTKAIMPFGGKVTAVAFCPCSANLVVTVGPPVGGVFSVEPGGTMLYPFYMIRSGVWDLGTYAPGGACLTFVPGGCVPMATPIGTIDMVGTSI